MTTHIPFATLLDYLDQSLPAPERAKTESHLATQCSECQTNLQRARELLAVFAVPDRTVAPPPEVVRRAVAAFTSRSNLAAIPQLIASLLFDSFQQAPATALRGATRTRQLLFSAQDLDIDMQITPERDSATLIGQVLTRTAAVLHALPVVRLYQAGEVIDTSYSDTLGQFAFRAVPPGRYDVGVWVDPQMVIIKGVELQHD
jgi:hypothetical protein